MKGNKKYCHDTGVRLTDCCNAYSTYTDSGLSCKVCFRPVLPGEGDGGEVGALYEIHAVHNDRPTFFLARAENEKKACELMRLRKPGCVGVYAAEIRRGRKNG